MSKKQSKSSSKMTGPLDIAWPKPQGRAESEATGGEQTNNQAASPPPGDPMAEMKTWLGDTLQDFKLDIKTTLKEELTSIRNDLQKSLEEQGKEVEELGERILLVEDTMPAVQEAMEFLKSELSDLKRQNAHLFSKCEDLENRERRANIRVRDVQEGAEGEDLVSFLQEICEFLVPDVPRKEFLFVRAHRVGPRPKPGAKFPRDIVAKFYNYELKERVMAEARKAGSLDCNGLKYAIYQDLAPSTLLRRSALRPITQELQKRQIRYRWTFPFGLTFSLDNKEHHIGTLDEGRRLLDITPTNGEETEESRPPFQGAIPWPWKIVTSARSRADRRPRRQPKNGTESKMGTQATTQDTG